MEKVNVSDNYLDCNGETTVESTSVETLMRMYSMQKNEGLKHF